MIQVSNSLKCLSRSVHALDIELEFSDDFKRHKAFQCLRDVGAKSFNEATWSKAYALV